VRRRPRQGHGVVTHWTLLVGLPAPWVGSWVGSCGSGPVGSCDGSSVGSGSGSVVGPGSEVLGVGSDGVSVAVSVGVGFGVGDTLGVGVDRFGPSSRVRLAASLGRTVSTVGVGDADVVVGGCTEVRW